MASAHGHLLKFSGSAADWDVFTEQLTYYFVANRIDDTDKKRGGPFFSVRVGRPPINC